MKLRPLCGVSLMILLVVTVAGAEQVLIVSPDPNFPVFDEVEVRIEISGDREVASAALTVDENPVGILRSPPFEWTTDVGGENREHAFRVVVTFADGTRSEHQVVTPAVTIDLELDLSLEQLYVTASREGHPVLDLRADEFSIVDGGRRRELVTFARGDIPMTLAVLVDASESMTGDNLRGAVEAAKGLFSRLTPLDEVMLMIFSDRLHHLSESTTDLDGLDTALESLVPGGGTALNDYLYAALRILDSRQGRPVVILLSDGVDTLSLLKSEEVLWKVRRSGAMVYRLQVQESSGRGFGNASVWRDFRSQKIEVDGMERVVSDSGGQSRIVPALDLLPSALDRILQELREQYVLGYYPDEDARSSRYRPVQVRVSRPDIDVRTRAGVGE